jgi:hypothetical protein
MKLSLLLGPMGLASLAGAAFMGMGGPDQQPYCARACRSVLGTANLTCTHMMHMGDHMMMATSPDCRANDDAFLTSLAYCFDTQCAGKVPIWQLEQCWAEVPAKWSYQEARKQVNGTPHMEWMRGHTLNMTMLVPQISWANWNNFMPVMDHNTALLYRYA